MTKSTAMNVRAVAEFIFDQIQAAPDSLQKAWTSRDSNELFTAFQVLHLSDYRPRRWYGLSVMNIQCIVSAEGGFHAAAVLSPSESLQLPDERLKPVLDTIAALARKDCQATVSWF